MEFGKYSTIPAQPGGEDLARPVTVIDIHICAHSSTSSEWCQALQAMQFKDNPASSGLNHDRQRP